MKPADEELCGSLAGGNGLDEKTHLFR